MSVWYGGVKGICKLVLIFDNSYCIGYMGVNNWIRFKLYKIEVFFDVLYFLIGKVKVFWLGEWRGGRR